MSEEKPKNIEFVIQELLFIPDRAWLNEAKQSKADRYSIVATRGKTTRVLSIPVSMVANINYVDDPEKNFDPRLLVGRIRNVSPRFDEKINDPFDTKHYDLFQLQLREGDKIYRGI